MKKVLIPFIASIMFVTSCGKDSGVEPEKVKFERPPDKVDTIPKVIEVGALPLK